MAKVKVARLVLRYDVILVDHGAGKLNVIKVVKTILGLGLKEAKDLVEAAPSVLKEKIEQAEAEAIKAQLVEAGATVEVRVHGMKPPAPPPTPAPSGDTFDVFLKDAGAGKLNVVKVVKTVLGLGLKEAKDLVDSAPTLLTGNVERDYAEAIKAQLVEAGATVEVRVHGEPAPSPAPAPAPSPAPVPTGFDVVLKDSGPNKLNVVKIVKTILGLGLKEAKDLVDSAPAVLKEKISKEEAEAIKAQLVEAGATVEVR